MKNSWVIVGLFAFLVHVAPAFCEDVTIGAIFPLSGKAAYIGEACQNGITMAIDSLPEADRSRIHVMYEDDKLVPKNTVSAFQKLAASGKVNAVLTLSSATSKAIAPLADARRIPVLAIASDPAIVKNKKYVFNLWVTPETQVQLMLERLKSLGIKKIARIYSEHDAILAYVEAFDRLNSGDFSIVLDDPYSTESRDFKPFLTKLKQRSDVDAIFAEVFFGQAGLFAKQARDLGITLPLFNIESFEDPNELKASEGALAGNWYIQADDPQADFLSAYQAKFPDKSYYSSANCYDAIGLLAKASSEGSSTSPEGLRDYLASVKDYRGALGTFSATGDNRYSLPATVKLVTESGFQKLDNQG